MASRRKLKKIIQFASSELIFDVYFHVLVSGKADEERTEKIVTQITANSLEFVLRSNRPTGKNNPKLVKEYYRKLYADWQTETSKIIAEIKNL